MNASEHYHYAQGESPLIVSMPHVGTVLPDAIAATMTGCARRLSDTDWHVDHLYNFLEGMDITLLRAKYSRYVIDLNRPIDGSALYPGSSETELCPTTTFDREPLYPPGAEPSAQQIQARIEEYWLPYHQCLEREIARLKAKHGYALLWDAHSIRSRVLRFFEGRLPDLNIGTGQGRSCAAELSDALLAAAREAEGFSAVLNGRFKGGYITRHYGDPKNHVHAVQLELVQENYMNETPDFEFREDRAALLRPVLKKMITAVLNYNPL